MCGVNGIFNISGNISDDINVLIGRMNDCIAHRGPDDSGTWRNDNDRVYLGHRRLSIIDLSTAGHQPMLNEHGSALIFNGEIYNYRELQALIKGHHLKSGSDTEILMELYQQKGHDALP